MKKNNEKKIVIKKRSQARELWMRLSKNKQAMFGLGIFILICLVSIFAGSIVNYDSQVIKQNISNKLQPPNSLHWLGTDGYGRDEFARIIYGGRISLSVGVVTAFVALFIGGVIGTIAGYFGKGIDSFLMRIMDVLLSLPSILLAIAIIAALGPGIINIMIAVAAANVPVYARVIRSSVLTIRNREFIEAAKALGTSDSRIIIKYILPNAIGPVIVQATLGVGHVIMETAALSFLGLGIGPPMPEWGSMLSEGREFMRDFPYLVIFPGVAIMLAVLSLNLLGDGLRDALDPRLR